MSQRRLLHVAPVYPEGGDRGGQVRVTATYKLLERAWQVRGIYLDADASRANASRDVTVLPNRGRSRFISASSRSRDRLLRLGQWLMLEAGLPSSDVFSACSPELRRTVTREASDVDVVLVEFGHLAPCRPAARPTVLVLHDLMWRKQNLAAEFRRDLTGSRPDFETRRLKAEARMLKRRELTEYADYDAVVTVSDPDRRALLDGWGEQRSETARPPVFVAPNGVDTQWFASVGAAGREGVAAFVGSLAHPPNRGAVHLLSTSIVPRMGSDLGELLLAGAGTDRFRTPPMVGLGRVDDIRTVYERASITLAPIRWGSGTRIKIIESLACGRPVVAFPEAAEGLDQLVASGAVLVAQDDQEFAEMATRLLGDPASASQLGAIGRRAAQDFDWPKVLAGLEQALEHAAESPIRRRSPAEGISPQDLRT